MRKYYSNIVSGYTKEMLNTDLELLLNSISSSDEEDGFKIENISFSSSYQVIPKEDVSDDVYETFNALVVYSFSQK